ncbi:Mur ligase [Amylocarpus encephaloides]|uniref:Folylpolyglutamate synthase n=1 Tax=Amylocarpus encephaloides TaxID=45428 RepID=A0A9P7YJC6_9HELO|nr:Mur ligase [Amylocarpus encephaloides]
MKPIRESLLVLASLGVISMIHIQKSDNSILSLQPHTHYHFSTASKPPNEESKYNKAIALLSTLQSNQAIRTSIADAPEDKNKDAIPEMLEWLRKAGHKPAGLARSGMRFIHVAGTSGKGSTCAMIESILLRYQAKEGRSVCKSGNALQKIGTYTSPHLMDVVERIRIDGKSVSKPIFAGHFMDLWNHFEAVARARSNGGLDVNASDIRPSYFRFLTILALRIFLEQGVNTAIIECGIGGEYDSTNILPSEAVSVSAITKLELDHVEMLGGTMQEVAWHKAGIIKPHVPTFTAVQTRDAMGVIKHRALEKSSELNVIARLPALNDGNIRLGLLGDFQKDNASLAVAVAASYLHQHEICADDIPSTEDLLSGSPLPFPFIEGLESVKWPGRCETYNLGKLQCYLDGAHTEDGIKGVAAWFRSKADEAFQQKDPPTATMLIFNQDERDGTLLLRSLLTHMDTYDSPLKWRTMFHYAIFCPNRAFPLEPDEPDFDLTKQEALERTYREIDRNSISTVVSSVGEAMRIANRISDDEKERVLVLITGSLHLVGAFLQYKYRGGRKAI